MTDAAALTVLAGGSMLIVALVLAGLWATAGGRS